MLRIQSLEGSTQSGFLVIGRITVSKHLSFDAQLEQITRYLQSWKLPSLNYSTTARTHCSWALWTTKGQLGSASQTFTGNTLVSVTLDIASRKRPALTDAINSTVDPLDELWEELEAIGSA